MKTAWQTTRLGDLYQIGSSKRVLKSQWKSEGVPYYRGREVTRLATDGLVDNELFISEDHFAELSKKYGAPKTGDIVITAIGTIGNSYVVRNGDRFYFKDASVLWMKQSAEICSEFVNFWFKSQLFSEQLDRGNGATVDTLTIQKLQSVEISFPPLPEQQRIVGVLDKAFADLASVQANAEKNLRNARDLLGSYVQSIFTDQRKDWNETRLGEICLFVRGPFGGSLKKSSFVDDGFAIYEQQHAIYDQFDEVRYFISEAKFEEMKRYELLPGDLIMSCSGTMGRVAIAPNGIKRGIINQALLKLTPSGKVRNRFLKLWMESKSFQDALGEYSGGAAIQNVASVKILKEIKVPLPPAPQQDRIVESIESFRSKTLRLADNYKQKSTALAALKNTLLHQAFSGQL